MTGVLTRSGDKDTDNADRGKSTEDKRRKWLTASQETGLRMKPVETLTSGLEPPEL